MPYLMRDENGKVCPECGGSGVIRNLQTLSPSDNEPCSCTEAEDDEEDWREGCGTTMLGQD